MSTQHMGLHQEGYLSHQRYRLTLTETYKELFEEAQASGQDATWMVWAIRGREFPSIVVNTARIELEEASSADIGTIIQYFSYRGKPIEDILQNISFDRL